MSPFYPSMPNVNNVCMPQISNPPVAVNDVEIPKSQPKPKTELNQSKGKIETEGKLKTARTNK